MKLEVKKYNVNYGLDLLSLSWDEVFTKRYKEYKEIYTKYEEKHKKKYEQKHKRIKMTNK